MPSLHGLSLPHIIVRGVWLTAPCLPLPLPHTARAGRCSGPSTAHQGVCRLGLSRGHEHVSDSIAMTVGYLIDCLTESNAGILLANILALLIGKEHIRGQATLRRIRIWATAMVSLRSVSNGRREGYLPFFFFSVPLPLALRVAGVLDFGMFATYGSVSVHGPSQVEKRRRDLDG